MSLTMDRGVVMCSSFMYWISTILMVFATASPYWSWGYLSNIVPPGQGNQQPYAGASVSASPFVAGFVWTAITSPNWCTVWWPPFTTYCTAVVSSFPLYWSQLTNPFVNSQICANASNPIYEFWAEPLGYCVSRGGQNNFVAPSEPLQAQGVAISACVFIFLTSIIACADAGTGPRPSFGLAALGTFCSCLSTALLAASFSLWASWSWVIQTNQSSGMYMPVWSQPSTNQLWAVPVSNVYGPGFGSVVTAFALTALGMLIQLFSMIDFIGAKEVDIPNVPEPKAGGTGIAQI